MPKSKVKEKVIANTNEHFVEEREKRKDIGNLSKKGVNSFGF